MFLLDPDDPGETGKPEEVIMGSGDGSPHRGPGAEPLMGFKGQSPRNSGLGAVPLKSEQVLIIIKTFLAEIFLTKSGMYRIIRTLTSVLIFSRQLLK